MGRAYVNWSTTIQGTKQNGTCLVSASGAELLENGINLHQVERPHAIDSDAVPLRFLTMQLD